MEGMAFSGRHGVLASERDLGARFTVDVEIESDLEQASRSDRLEDTIDYGRAHETVRQVVEGEPCNLLEAVAGRIADRLIDENPRLRRATVRVRKVPPLAGEFRSVGVEISRTRL